MTGLTVIIISAAYSRIIEQFPYGGGGYIVATKLLGEKVGLISGCALLIDYVLTITVSIAAAGDAIFSFLPMALHGWKLPFEVFLILALSTLNIRGVKESIISLLPIFIIFLITHAILIIGGIIAHSPQLPETIENARTGFDSGLVTLGIGGMFLLFIHAYSLGGGTYTGIEAVSNSMMIMREPRVQTAKRTMLYLSSSLAITAAGLIICYLLWDVTAIEGKTSNAVLAENFIGNFPGGTLFVILTLFSEGTLLIVAAQAGFLAGPRVLANMAVDSWAPRRFAALSDRLTTQNGIIVMAAISLVALLYTQGDVQHLVVMYSINVFLTFSLSMLGMALLYIKSHKLRAHWKKSTALFILGFFLCATILVFTILVKFEEGGWLTLAATGSLVVFCVLIRRHYRRVGAALSQLYAELGKLPRSTEPVGEIDPEQATAAVLVGSYGGLGIHTLLNIFRSFPNHFKNVVFLSVGVIDSGGFKGEDAVDSLKSDTGAFLQKYVDLAHGIGVPATYRMAVGTDAVEEAEKLCLEVAREFSHTTYFAGKVIFQREHWYQYLLHNETAFAIQKRLQWAGRTMVILPARIES